MSTVRIDAEARIDSATNNEIARIDAIMNNLINNPEWIYMMGQGYGKTPMEVKNGAARFSESLRKLHLGVKEQYIPEYAGAQALFKRCDTLEDRASNIRAIEAHIDMNKRNLIRADTESGVFYEPDLTGLDPNRYRVLKGVTGFYQRFLPTRAISLGETRTSYRMYEGTGQTGASSPGTMGGVPYVGVRSEPFFAPVRSEKVGYQLTTDDQRKAAYANEPLIEELLMAAQMAVQTAIDRSAWLGNLTLGLNGAINHPGVPNIQASLDSGVRSWKNLTKSNDAVFADINSATSQIATDSGENFNPETTDFIMLLDRATKQALNRRMAAGTDTTLIQFIRNNTDAGIKNIGVIRSDYIAGSGPAGSDQALIYPFDEKVIRFRVNTDIIWAPMQWHDLTLKFPGEIIYGDVETPYPVAMIQIYDI